MTEPSKTRIPSSSLAEFLSSSELTLFGYQPKPGYQRLCTQPKSSETRAVLEAKQLASMRGGDGILYEEGSPREEGAGWRVIFYVVEKIPSEPIEGEGKSLDTTVSRGGIDILGGS